MEKEYKRYLLREEVSDILKDLKNKHFISDIFFTKIKLCKEIKYERTNSLYQKIVRSGTQHMQRVRFKHIDKKTYRQKKDQREGDLLHVSVYIIKTDNCTMHLEAYEHKLKGLYLLTVPNDCFSLSKTDTVHNTFIGKFIEANVSDDPRYEQKYLALFGNPTKHPYNIYAIFKDLEQKRLQDPHDVIFQEMKSADAIRIYLYEQYLLLQKYTKDVQKPDTTEDADHKKAIEKYRNVIQSAITIIKSYEEIFDEQQYRKILFHMTTLKSITDTYVDLIFIGSKISKLNKKLHSDYLKKILQNIKKKTKLELHKIGNYFNSREFQIISGQLHRFIHEKNNSYINYESQLPFKYSADIKVSDTYSKLLHMISFLDGCNDEKSYEKLQTTFEEMIDFLTVIEKEIDSDTHKKLLQKCKHIYKVLEKNSEQNRYLLIINMLLSHLNEQERPKNKEIVCLRKKRKHLLQKKQKFGSNILLENLEI